MKTNMVSRNSKRDIFKKKGHFGKRDGFVFEDLKRFSDWRITKLIIESSDNIKSIQTFYTNQFFPKNMLSQIHGNQERNTSIVHVLEIPDHSHISKIKIFLDSLNNLKGIKFYFSNGQISKTFGSRLKLIKKEVYFTNREYFIGFFGTYKNDCITSLGFLLNIQNGDHFSVFK